MTPPGVTAGKLLWARRAYLAGRDAEEVLAVYLAAADAAPDEAQLAEAQRLAETALARLALIRAQIRARSPEGR